MMAKTNLDELSPVSRDYYERALMKMSLSLVFAALAFMFLGFAAQAGGLSSGNGSFAQSNNLAVTSDVQDAFNAQSSGYGFGCFSYVVAFLISSAVSIYLSPLLIGTPNEKRMLSNPQNIDAEAGHGGASAPPVVVGGQTGGATYDGYPSKTI